MYLFAIAGNNTTENDSYCNLRTGTGPGGSGTASGLGIVRCTFEPPHYGRQMLITASYIGVRRMFNVISSVASTGGTQGVSHLGTGGVIYDFVGSAIATS